MTATSPKSLTADQRKEAVTGMLDDIISFEQRALDTLPPRVLGLRGIGTDVHHIQRRYSTTRIETAKHFVNFEHRMNWDIRSEAKIWIERAGDIDAKFAIEAEAQRNVAQAILTELAHAWDIDG